MFERIEGAGFTGHYMCGWGAIAQMLEGREYLVELGNAAGVVDETIVRAHMPDQRGLIAPAGCDYRPRQNKEEMTQ
jgi:hypothetical protein